MADPRKQLPKSRHGRSNWDKPLHRWEYEESQRIGKSDSARRTEEEYPGSEVLSEAE